MSIQVAEGIWISTDKQQNFVLEYEVTSKAKKGPNKGKNITGIKAGYFPTLSSAIKSALCILVSRHTKLKRRINWEKIEKSPKALKLLEGKYGDVMQLHRIVNKALKQLNESCKGLSRKDLIEITKELKEK